MELNFCYRLAGEEDIQLQQHQGCNTEQHREQRSQRFLGIKIGVLNLSQILLEVKNLVKIALKSVFCQEALDLIANNILYRHLEVTPVELLS